MDNVLNLGEVIQRFTGADEQTLRVIDDLQDQDFMRARRYSRTDARNAFFRIAGADAVSIVSNHARLEESSVIMPLHLLARIMSQLVHRAQDARTPMSSVLAGLRPLRGTLGEEAGTLRVDEDGPGHPLDASGPQAG